jgi:hypothetical protein
MDSTVLTIIENENENKNRSKSAQMMNFFKTAKFYFFKHCMVSIILLAILIFSILILKNLVLASEIKGLKGKL